MKSYITKVQCLECQHEMSFYPGLDKCPNCNGVWLDAQYDYDKVAKIWQNGIDRRGYSLWRYIELLPVLDTEHLNTMGEGYTPLTRATKIQNRLSHPSIFIKDERQSPTSSFKDRQAAVATTAMKQANIQECVLASTGNAAAAYASYCARADIKLWIFLTSMVPAAKMREAALYGAEVVKVAGTYDQAKKVAADFAAHRGIHFDKGAKAIPGKESMKTVAFEIAEELARQKGFQTPWQAPDWYIQAVSGGIGPIGVQKGFEELFKMGLIDRVPKIGVVQVAGCSPMVRAYSAGKPTAAPVVPETRITVLSTGAPGLGYELLFKANQTYGGHMLSVTDEEAFESMRLLAQTEGYSVEPATAVAFAGLDKLVTQGIIKSDETVVVNCSGHTFPVEKHIMDEENLLDVQLSGSKEASASVPLDGLGAALKRLDEQVTTIVVIDDNPMDSRLIRRLLQAKKPYRVFEANTALEGLKIIRDRLPDLVVSDLTMPEMDGFALLQELKSDPLTANIPVIVVSAKDLTKDDEQRLAGQTSSVWMKGSFSTKDLVEHVVDTLSGTIPEQPVEQNERTKTKELVIPPPSQADNSIADKLQLKKVVLIEDSSIDARLISRILQMKLPVSITHVTDGENAIEVIKKEKPHLITLDLNMPDKSGYQILEDLKDNEELDSIPVIVITSQILSDAEKEFLTRNDVRSVWQKGDINREKLIAHVESELQYS
ncbi:MAG: pyridoxal-phosphate dependent enzyme [Anaerolineae bacterium]|nr:pyridoxal-phosphate dependent enzyme [Anaerolineae bacterium]